MMSDSVKAAQVIKAFKFDNVYISLTLTTLKYVLYKPWRSKGFSF